MLTAFLGSLRKTSWCQALAPSGKLHVPAICWGVRGGGGLPVRESRWPGLSSRRTSWIATSLERTLLDPIGLVHLADVPQG